MTRIARLAAALLLLATPALSQVCGATDLFDSLTPDEARAIDAVVKGTPFAEGTLWLATRGEDSVTVVGTMHIPDARHYGVVDRLAPRIEAADLLVVEATAADEQRLIEMTVSDPGLFFLTEGPTLIDLLGPEDWARAESRFTEAGVPAFIGAKFRPWYAGMVIGMPSCVTELVASGAQGLDRMIEARAEAAGVPVAAIEAVEDVMALLAGGDDAEDLESLRLGLKSELNGEDMIATMIESYFEGRTTAAWELGRVVAERDLPGQGADLFAEFTEVLLTTRNQAWEADLPTLIDGRDVVLAVGAAHLPGEAGILRALERLGYVVTPLP